MRFTGTLKTWDEERGYGLIAPVGGGQEIVVQRKALPRDGHWPQVGETLSFEIEAGPEGQKRATRVQRQSSAQPAPQRRTAPPDRAQPTAPSRWQSKSVLLLVIAGLGLFGYDEVERQGLLGRQVATPAAPVASFRCDGRSRCTEMKSCAEAKLFLQHCPGVKLDEDGNGIPCEPQWCR